MRTKTKRILFLLLVAVMLFTAIPAINHKLSKFTDSLGYTALRDYSEMYEVNIHFISTYSSDCIVLECGDKFVLFDGGYYSLYPQIDKYFQELSITEFAAIINTHPDNDHIGCIPHILENYKAEVLYCSPVSEYTDTAENALLLDSAEKSGVDTVFLTEGDEFSIEGFRFQVLAPYEQSEDTNAMSLVIKVTKDDFSALFTGDSGKDELMEAHERGMTLKAEILKVPHHGSITSMNEDIADIIDPEYAVITVNKNSYGHPDPKVVEVFEKKQIPLLLTENNGTIIISSNCDGKYVINSVDSGG